MFVCRKKILITKTIIYHHVSNNSLTILSIISRKFALLSDVITTCIILTLYMMVYMTFSIPLSEN